MGYANDLGTGTVKDIDPVTGYPRDEYGHLLDPISGWDGSIVPNWDKPGTQLANFTSPYGFLEYAVGSGDDFTCFDSKEINAGPRGMFIILHSVINSETGSFIMDGEYYVLPCNTSQEERNAIQTASGMIDQAITWCYDNGVRHTRKGWNQDPCYFANDVARSLHKWKFEKVSDRMLRMNTKTVQKIMDELLRGHP